VSIRRLAAIGVIFCGTSLGWFTLGHSLVSRSGEMDQKLAEEVVALWGGRHRQTVPAAWVERSREVAETVEEKDAAGTTKQRQVTKTVTEPVTMPLESSRVEVALSLDPRKKGLLWYDTYAVTFSAAYRFRNPDDVGRDASVRFQFPSREALYDDFVFRVNGVESAAVSDLSRAIAGRSALPPGGEAVVEVRYRSRGLGPWFYAFGAGPVTQVRDFHLTLRTDFAAIDFPPGTLSPTGKAREGSGWALDWRFSSLVTGQKIGLDPPDRLNPGPLAARITFFAPVSLLFFLSVLIVLGILAGHSLHPMHYFFLATAFFAFHLLLAYLVDHLDVHLAFALASAVSIGLVVSYLRIVGGLRLALARAGLAQLVYLVLFSYAFFFEGYTGLTVTVGAVLTLAVLMQLTARVDWERAFSR
jgi:hypothetical protein